LALRHLNFANLPSIDTKEAFGKKIGTKQKFDIALLDLGFSNY